MPNRSLLQVLLLPARRELRIHRLPPELALSRLTLVRRRRLRPLRLPLPSPQFVCLLDFAIWVTHVIFRGTYSSSLVLFRTILNCSLFSQSAIQFAVNSFSFPHLITQSGIKAAENPVGRELLLLGGQLRKVSRTSAVHSPQTLLDLVLAHFQWQEGFQQDASEVLQYFCNSFAKHLHGNDLVHKRINPNCDECMTENRTFESTLLLNLPVKVSVIAIGSKPPAKVRFASTSLVFNFVIVAADLQRPI